MTGADQLAVRSQKGAGNGQKDGLGAELVLVGLADVRAMMASRLVATAAVIAAGVVLALAGVWLPGHALAGWPVVAGLALPTRSATAGTLLRRPPDTTAITMRHQEQEGSRRCPAA